MSLRVAKENIWQEDAEGVRRLVVAQGDVVPDGVEVPDDSVESTERDPHVVAREEQERAALRSQGRDEEADAVGPKRSGARRRS